MPETERAKRMVELTTPYFSHFSTATFQTRLPMQYAWFNYILSTVYQI